ncbi:siderophore ABC transporter substrate-binding protein [Paenibacillus sp. IITD108]|uniref:siderophore ABC transporter substrate-binding protein n=1 Tax=Paenibacillus sp. IITD108 TaxID=3116649 RepID=UPI002F41BC15
MKKSLTLAILVLALTMVLAACGGKNDGNSGGASSTPSNSPSSNPSSEPSSPAQPTEITVKHSLGEDTVPVNPQKVVVFDFGTLDTLDKLGVEVASVPQSSVPGYLEKYKDSKYVNAGALKEPDMETIHGMKPDLIIISGRQSDYYKELSEIAPTIFMGVDNENFMESFKSNVKTLGEIFSKQSEAEAALTEIDKKIAEIREIAAASGKNGLVILANEGNLSAYGPNSRFGLIHDVFGLTAVDTKIEVSTHGQPVTFEYIAEKNPDYLFVIDRNAVVEGSGNAKETLNNDLVKNTTAFKENQVAYLNPDYWYLSGGGLISVAEMVDEVEAALK